MYTRENQIGDKLHLNGKCCMTILHRCHGHTAELRHGALVQVAEAKSEGPYEGDEGTAGAMAAREQVGKLLKAAQAGDLKQLQAVAPSFGVGGVKAVKDGNGRSALHFAAQAGQARTAFYLIDEEELDVNQQDDKGEPLTLQHLLQAICE